jgi:cell division protein FtsB
MWSRLTTRAAILLLVLAALVLTLAFPLREYVAQRSQIGALKQEIASRQHAVTTLQKQQQQWADPAYVELQARQQLHYVFPGETGLVLLSPDDVKQARSPEINRPVKPKVAWFSTLWQSVQAADGTS